MFTMLDGMNGVSCLEPQGAFYCFPSMHGTLDRDIGGASASSSLELATLCLEQAGVAFVPGEAFGAPGYARFSYSIDDDDLATGLTRLGELLGTD